VAINTNVKRLLAAFIDLAILPLLIGLGVGIFLSNVDESTRTKTLSAVGVLLSYIVFFRDFIYSPGRHIFGLDLVNSKTKVRVCFYRGNILLNLLKAFLRNVLFVIPLVLVIAYIVETFMVFKKGHRLTDRWLGTEVIAKG